MLGSLAHGCTEFAKNEEGYPHEVVQKASRTVTTPTPPPPVSPEIFQGRETGAWTTQRRAYPAYHHEMPTAFVTRVEHRRPRDEYTDYVEKILRARQIFGMERR